MLNSIDVTWPYVSQIMSADTVAAGSPKVYGTAYYDSMWASTGSFTHSQFQLASQMVASLWYSAWVDAGSPIPILAEPKWFINSDGPWNAFSSWGTNVPNGIDAKATFGSAINAPRTVTLDSPQTVGTLKFDNVNRYTLAGPGTITIQSTGTGSINSVSGSHTISAPLHLASKTQIQAFGFGNTLTITGDMVSDPGLMLTKVGNGTLELKNLRVGSVNINAGRITILPGAAPNSPGGVSRVGTIIFAGSSYPTTGLNLSNNALVQDYDSASPIASTRGSLQYGFNTGGWDGFGIASSTAAAVAADPSSPARTAIGYAEASALGISSFCGNSVDSTTLLLMYTLSADANLDGVVNGLDFNALASNYSSVYGKVWTQGDFNYDGHSNSLDFYFIAENFNRTLPVSAALSTPAPEPVGIAIVSAILLWFPGGRRRNR